MVMRKLLETGIKAVATMAGALAIETVKTNIKPHVKPMLRGLGKQRLKRLVKQEVSLWDIWPEKEGLLTLLEPYRTMLLSLDVRDVVVVIREVIEETCPEYSFLPDEWIAKGIEELKAGLSG